MNNGRDVVLLPLKNFGEAKSRLRASSTITSVDELVRNLARGVIMACRPRTVMILSDNEEVATFALAEGAAYVHSPRGLNAAVQAAYDELTADVDRVIIVHGDLLRPAGLGTYEFSTGVTVVTDRHGIGTNVLAVPTGARFQFHFGSNSAELHEKEARRLDLPVVVERHSPWGHDVDEPDDLSGV